MIQFGFRCQQWIFNPMSETLLTFPCRFPIKAMGLACEEFETLVLDTLLQHLETHSMPEIHSRPSRDGKYQAVTVTFTATSKAQIDAMYQALHAHERVVMVL